MKKNCDILAALGGLGGRREAPASGLHAAPDLRAAPGGRSCWARGPARRARSAGVRRWRSVPAAGGADAARLNGASQLLNFNRT